MATTTRKAKSRRQARQEARQERRGGRQEARQERRSSRQEARQTTGRKARKTKRQEARQARRQERIGARTERKEARHARRLGQTAAKAAGGKWDPESVEARWEGIAAVTESGTELAGDLGEAYMASQTGGLSELGSFFATDEEVPGSDLLEFDEFGDDYTTSIMDEDWYWPVVIGGTGLALYLLMRKPAKG